MLYNAHFALKFSWISIKIERVICLSVHLHFFLVTLITLSCVHRSKPDLLKTIAMSSGISKFIFWSFQDLSSFNNEALKTPMSAIIKKAAGSNPVEVTFLVNAVTFFLAYCRHAANLVMDLVLCDSCGLARTRLFYKSVSAFGCRHERLKGSGVIPFWLAWICKAFELRLSSSHLATL